MDPEMLHREFLKSAGVSTDSRQDVSGTLFFALKGEKFDGNRYVQSAVDKGCRLAITEDQVLYGQNRVLVVPSSLGTLQQLALRHRRYVDPNLLAVTGSNGKTTTKELISLVLGQKFRTMATSGNLNNHIGVPLTLLRLEKEEVAVVEMGANHPGEIAALTTIAEPDLGIITNVGKAHLEGFGSLEGVLEAKGELFAYLAEHGGSAIVDTSDDMLMERALSAGVTVLGAGEEGSLRVSVKVAGQSPFLEVDLRLEGRTHRIVTKMVGEYNVQNILYAAATGLHFGISGDAIVSAITSYLPQNQRSQWLKGRSNSLMLDAYNANPTSMREAISGMTALASGPVMLILGDMAELGENTLKEHKALTEWIGNLQPEITYLVGPVFQKANSTTNRIRTFRDREALEAHLRENPPVGYQILLKGSRVMELEKVVDLLMD